MLRYILKRFMMLLPVLFGVSLISFGLLHMVPGDPAVMAGVVASQRDNKNVELGKSVEKTSLGSILRR